MVREKLAACFKSTRSFFNSHRKRQNLSQHCGYTLFNGLTMTRISSKSLDFVLLPPLPMTVGRLPAVPLFYQFMSCLVTKIGLSLKIVSTHYRIKKSAKINLKERKRKEKWFPQRLLPRWVCCLAMLLQIDHQQCVVYHWPLWGRCSRLQQYVVYLYQLTYPQFFKVFQNVWL